MFCKSGILIFIFSENNHLVRQYICTHRVDQNIFAPTELGSPYLSFYSFSLSVSLFLANFLERGGPLSSLSCPGSQDPLEKGHCAFTHSRGRMVPTCSSVSPKNRTLLAFRIKQGILASFSLLLSSSFFFSLLLFSYRRLRTTRFRSIKGQTVFVSG